MSKLPDKTEIKAVECRFAVYMPPASGEQDDYHLVKEIIHTHSGERIPYLRRIKNYERKFWSTRKSYRNHQQKKEWEDLDKLQEHRTTQSALIRNAAKALEMPWYNGGLRKLARSPYLYGADIASTAVIKQSYMDQYPDTITPFSIACFDTETNVVLMGDNRIVIATVSFKDRVYTSITKGFLEGIGGNVTERLQVLLDKYLGEYVAKRNIKWEINIADDDVMVIRNCFMKVHEWKPDFLAIWNMNFDIPKVIEALEREGIDPADIFSDPSIPPKYRFFKYKQGPNQKVTASGKVTPIKPAAQWHTVVCPSSFYVIDAMCAYRHIRTGSAEEASYALDNILNAKLGIRKLKFEEASQHSGLKWHMVMQTDFKLEYIIYNVFDCISMEELNEKTRDLDISLPMMSGCSDFENFKSQPRRVVDQLHYFCLKMDPPRVIGTTSDEMSTDMDEITIGLKDWIVMLPAHQVEDNGLCVIEEAPSLRTNIRRDVGDLDVSASYPNGECVFNVSKETTSRELISIEGVSEQTRRMQGINLCAGQTNAVEVCVGLFKLPTLDQMLDQFVKDSALVIDEVREEDTKFINAFIASDEELARAANQRFDDEEESA